MDNKYLYRKNWVDAADFAISQIEAEPAKNPSFWIKKTEIHHRYGKLGEFWLPLRNWNRDQDAAGRGRESDHRLLGLCGCGCRAVIETTA